MAECKHEQHMLLGTATGIICRGCGKLFQSYADIYPPEEEKPAESPREPQRAPESPRKENRKPR